MSFRSVLVAAILAATVVPVLAAAPALAADDVTWAVRTVDNDLGHARTAYDYTVDPGQTLHDAVMVSNRGTEPVTLAVQTADGAHTEDGAFDLAASDEEATAVGAWVSPDVAEITLAAGESTTVPFTVSVPVDATPGDYAGGIVTTLAAGTDGAGIGVDRRLGIRIDLRITGDLRPVVTAEDATLSWQGDGSLLTGVATLTYTLRNEGNMRADVAASASASGPFGWFGTAEVSHEAVTGLLPGESRAVSVQIPGLTAAIVAIGTATVTPVVMDASGSTASLAPVTLVAWSWAAPWPLVVGIVVAIALIVLIVFAVRRRRNARRRAQDERVRVAVEAALADAELERV